MHDTGDVPDQLGPGHAEGIEHGFGDPDEAKWSDFLTLWWVLGIVVNDLVFQRFHWLQGAFCLHWLMSVHLIIGLIMHYTFGIVSTMGGYHPCIQATLHIFPRNLSVFGGSMACFIVYSTQALVKSCPLCVFLIRANGVLITCLDCQLWASIAWEVIWQVQTEIVDELECMIRMKDTQ